MAAVKSQNPFEFTLGGLTQDATAIGARVIAKIDCPQKGEYRLEFDLTPGSAKLSASLYFRTVPQNMQNAYRLEFSNSEIGLNKIAFSMPTKLVSVPWAPPASGPARFLLVADGKRIKLTDRATGASLLSVADSTYPQGQCFFPVANSGSKVTWSMRGVPA